MSFWTQVFYELWAPKDLLKRRMAGGNDPWPDYERMKVVLLANRAEYLKLLGGSEENIGVSVGYYNPTIKMSIFYQAEDLEDTLYHELTHQLFPKLQHSIARQCSKRSKAHGVSKAWLFTWNRSSHAAKVGP